ncbi:LysR family transcriptional regulator [Catellatospora sp. TT07R-123]|uniref:DoxX family protein n=1 Tax=Catellatospora sp. TT07R-123 TaxID=2733863 RepID=UPI001B233B0B|nr:DoxX family protein [Catellatospora sp. TT07R-123]GHJ48176.1 LysR family transcriptional regulator [Catellatospora sp. TT07R-123]
MDVLLLIGRILLALIFLGSGINHLAKPHDVVGYSEYRNAPVAAGMVRATGAWILLGGLSVALGILGDLGVLMLILFLLATAFRVHHFWTDTDPAVKATELAMFMKNIAIVGGLLLAFVLFRTETAGWTLTGPMF